MCVGGGGTARHGDPSRHQTLGEATFRHPLLQNKPGLIGSFAKPQLLRLASIINLHQAPAPGIPPHAGAGHPEQHPRGAALERGRGRHEELLPESRLGALLC